MELSGFQIESLRDALLAAFPAQGDLAQMVRFRLDENLDAIYSDLSRRSNGSFN